MNDTEEVGGPLPELINVAQVIIPQMASDLAPADNTAAAAIESSSGAFTVGENRHGGQSSTVGAAWSALMQTYQGVVAQTLHNLQDTSTVITEMINGFAETDKYGAGDLTGIIDRYNEQPGSKLPPPGSDGKYDDPKFGEDGDDKNADIKDPEVELPEPGESGERNEDLNKPDD